MTTFNWFITPQPLPVRQCMLPRTAERIDRVAGNGDGKVSVEEIDRVLASPDRYLGSVLRSQSEPALASPADVQFLRNTVAGNTPLRQLKLMLFGGSTYGDSNLVRDPVSGKIVAIKPELR